MMSFLPNTRHSSALSRSLSTPILNQENSSNKKSFKGLKSWWNKISNRFHNIKNRENNFSHSVSINIIPDEPDTEIEQLEDNIDNGTMFTLGFSAATCDLPSDSLQIVQPPQINEMIILDTDGSRSPECYIGNKYDYNINLGVVSVYLCP